MGRSGSYLKDCGGFHHNAGCSCIGEIFLVQHKRHVQQIFRNQEFFPYIMAVSCKNWQEPDVNSPTFVTDEHCHWLVETSGRQLIIDR